MDTGSIFRTLTECILVIAFVLLVVSAYRQHEINSAAAELSNVTCSISTHLLVDELAPEKEPYVIDRSKLGELENFEYSIGGKSFKFRIEVSRMGVENSESFGPTPPEKQMTCALELPFTLLDNNRLTPSKLKVITWRN